MKPDPAADVTTGPRMPPAHGPGSGKAAWIEFAKRVVSANQSLMDVISQQSLLLAELSGEVRLLREQIASRKPRGGRERMPDETVDEIEAALKAGWSTREIGRRFKVSPMTVSRVRKRVSARHDQPA